MFFLWSCVRACPSSRCSSVVMAFSRGVVMGIAAAGGAASHIGGRFDDDGCPSPVE